jgi:hypothetical protein
LLDLEIILLTQHVLNVLHLVNAVRDAVKETALGSPAQNADVVGREVDETEIAPVIGLIVTEKEVSTVIGNETVNARETGMTDVVRAEKIDTVAGIVDTVLTVKETGTVASVTGRMDTVAGSALTMAKT